jgi:hypothetical protein
MSAFVDARCRCVDAESVAVEPAEAIDTRIGTNPGDASPRGTQFLTDHAGAAAAQLTAGLHARRRPEQLWM